MTYNRFYDRNHVARYLTNTMIRVNNEPAWVVDTGHDGEDYTMSYVTKFKDVAGGSVPDLRFMKQCRVAEDNVNLNPIPLGMVNLETNRTNTGQTVKVCTYTVRMPKRQWIIGLSPRTMHYYGPEPSAIRDHDILIDGSFILYSDGMKKTILNDFPSFRRARELVMKDRTYSVAFSRRWRLTRRGELKYKWFPDVIGLVSDAGQITLARDKQYLEQALYEDIR
jgi:hypothetical protein